MMTLDELIAHQAQIDAGHVHLAVVEPLSFRLAHTDEERACGANTEACPAHRWLSEFSGPPVEAGVYAVVDYEPDAYSESHPLPPYELIPLAAFSTSHESDAPVGQSENLNILPGGFFAQLLATSREQPS